jgi:hypothetical protein
MEYYNTLNDLYTSDDRLVRNFQESIFPASTFNLGPNTVTLDHIDYANVAYGLCGISALGEYNPDKGVVPTTYMIKSRQLPGQSFESGQGKL